MDKPNDCILNLFILVLNRLNNFIPRLKEANVLLEQEIKDENKKRKIEIENIETSDYIEMV